MPLSSSDDPDGERVAIRRATAGSDGGDDGQNEAQNADRDEHGNADDEEAQQRRNDRPEDQVDLEVEHLFGLVLDEGRVRDEHDDQRHEDVAEDGGGQKRDQMADDSQGSLLAGGVAEIGCRHVVLS